MNKRKLLAILTAAVLMFSIVGCGAQKYDEEQYTSPVSEPAVSEQIDAMESKVMAQEEPLVEEYQQNMTDDYAEVSALDEAPQTGGGGEIVQTEALEVRERKLVENISLDLQTKEFDKAVAEIEKAIGETGGYIQYSSVNNNNIYTLPNEQSNRSASFSARIPSDGSKSFVETLSTNYHVLSSSSSTEDITSSYYDTETQLETLLDHEKRLIDLLDREEDGELEYIIQIEKELANVRYQINSINSQIQNMDNLVSYDTIYIMINEVIDYKEVDKIEDSFGTRISRALKNSWSNFVVFMEDFAIGLIYVLPAIIILAIIIVIAIIIVRKKRKKSKNDDEGLEPVLHALPTEDPEKQD